MKLKYFLSLTFLSFVLSGLMFGCETTKVETKPLNVLFISVDDLNDCLGFMNGYLKAKTPNLDKLAKKGIYFANAHCQAPLCGPSRASIMTGLRPSTTGVYGMIDDDNIRSENPAIKDIVFLPEYFRNNGYHIMGIGKLFHTHAPKGVFDESGGRVKGFGPVPEKRFVWDGHGTADQEKYGGTSTDWGAFPEADSLMPDHGLANWTIERLNRKHDKPFFLATGFLRPHVPWYVPQKWFDLYPLNQIQTPPYKADDLNDIPSVGLQINDLPMMPSTQWAIESGEWTKIVQAYLASVSFVDYEIGRLLKALEKSEYANNTVIVLWSDHGYRLGEKGNLAKHALWERATNPPLFFAAPNLPKDKVINSPAEMLSIYPTLLDLCGLPDYKKNEGQSLVPVMPESLNEEAIAITTHGMNNHAIRSNEFRYIQYEDGGEELYNRNNDPNEWTNKSNNLDYIAIKDSLKKILPKENVKWDKHSLYNAQSYFKEQNKKSTDK